MRKEHHNKGTKMDHIKMTEARAATMRRVLENRPLLKMLRPEDREALIQQYVVNLEKWENR